MEDARAISDLAQTYLKSSYKKALELFEKAAALDEPYALFCLGKFYRDSNYGLEQDGYKAAEYFIRAAENAIPNDAAKYLRLAAGIYRYGEAGVTPDAQKVISLYQKLDELEAGGEVETFSSNNKAIFLLAAIYTEGCANLKPDAQKAIEYLNKAAARGDDWAFYKLAEFYREGKAGIAPDGYKAIKYLSERGDWKEIAWIYRDGKYNVKPDGVKLIKYLTKKMAQDDSNDFIPYNIAEVYEEGCGTLEPNMQKALEFYRKSVALGNKDAAKKLAQLEN